MNKEGEELAVLTLFHAFLVSACIYLVSHFRSFLVPMPVLKRTAF